MRARDSTLEMEAPEHEQRAAPPQIAPPPVRQREPEGANERQHATEVTGQDAKQPRDARPWHRRIVAATPGWLVSLVVHLLLVVLLAILIVPGAAKPAGTFLQAYDAETETLEFFKPVKMEAVELKNMELVAASVSSADVTSTSLADAADLGAVAATLSADDFDVPVGTEIGELFTGAGGGRMGSALPSGADKSAQFFGVKASGRRFVFIVDSSNSMKNGKFDAAREELMYAIRRLSKDQAFYIIFFDQDAERMLLPPDTEPALLPVPAVNANINRAEQWVGTVANELRTDPYEAVKFAVEMVPDAIYILTDGQFTDRGLTERWLKNNNIIDEPIEGRRPKVVIHTICFWQKDGEETLQAIAKAYGGTYRFVPPAPRMKKK